MKIVEVNFDDISDDLVKEIRQLTKNFTEQDTLLIKYNESGFTDKIYVLSNFQYEFEKAVIGMKGRLFFQLY